MRWYVVPATGDVPKGRSCQSISPWKDDKFVMYGGFISVDNYEIEADDCCSVVDIGTPEKP